MYDESTLRQLANWEPVPPASEAAALEAAKAVARHISQVAGLAAFAHEGSYENFTPAYVYLPASVTRRQGPDGHVRSNYESVVLYFSHLVPLIALGTGSWGETQNENGKVIAWGYSGLDTPNLVGHEQLPDGPMKAVLLQAVGLSGYTIAQPSALLAEAPSWFEPLQRSEGVPPWNRVFHLLFQFCD